MPTLSAPELLKSLRYLSIAKLGIAYANKHTLSPVASLQINLIGYAPAGTASSAAIPTLELSLSSVLSILLIACI